MQKEVKENRNMAAHDGYEKQKKLNLCLNKIFEHRDLGWYISEVKETDIKETVLCLKHNFIGITALNWLDQLVSLYGFSLIIENIEGNVVIRLY